jgi:hypothetical protein
MGPGMPGDHRPSARAVAAAAPVAVYGWWAVGLAPFSSEATVAVVGAGVATAVWAAWRRRRAGPWSRPGSRGAGGTYEARGVGVVPWVLLAAAAAAWQLAAYVQHPRDDHPTLSSLANAALESHAARTAAFVVWLVTTVALVRR